MPKRRKIPSKEALLSRNLIEEAATQGRNLTPAEIDALVRRLRKRKAKPTPGVKLHARKK